MSDLAVIERGELAAQSGAMDIATTRSAQEVQAAMVIAKRFPRDINAAYTRIMQACDRKSFAEVSQYAYPRGGSTVSGPSIRMAEMLAQNYGNLDFGIVELEQRDGESVVQAYAWDLETNTRQTKVFTVKHVRDTKQGQVKLKDARDVYEMTANQGARRVRACILGVIPGDVVEAAIERCDKTMATGNKEPLIDRARKMLSVFAEIGVNQEMIEQRIGHKLDTINETELVALRKIFQSIRDNFAPREQFFAAPQAPAGQSVADKLTEKLTAQKKTKVEKPKAAEPEQIPAPPAETDGDPVPFDPESPVPPDPEPSPEVEMVSLVECGSLPEGAERRTSGVVSKIEKKTVTIQNKQRPVSEVTVFFGIAARMFSFWGTLPAFVKTGAKVIVEFKVTKPFNGQATFRASGFLAEQQQ